MLERHHLEIIRAIDQLGSLTRAAERLCLTQSALSHSIKKLEQQLGSPLWQKQGQKLLFSPAGKKILGLANRVLPQFEHTELAVQHLASGQQGALRIGMECYPCFDWLMQVIAPFLKLYPDVDVDIRKDFQFGGLGALLCYDVDVLITPDPVYKKTLSYIPVFEYELVLVVSSQHRLANQQQVLPIELNDEVLLTYPVEISRLDLFCQFITPAGVAIKSHKTIEDIEIMMQMVNANRGITALPRWLASEFQQRMSLNTLRLGEHGIDKRIYLGLRAEQPRPPYLEQLIRLAKASRVR